MKEAAGEANLTVIAIILIAVVVAVATPLVKSLMKTSTKRSCCTDAGAVWRGNKCTTDETNGVTKAAMEDDYIECQANAGVPEDQREGF